MPQIGYVVYIDEAGDDGIKKIRSGTESGASEWMVISALVIHASDEARTVMWLKDAIAQTNRHQIKHLHFHTLDHNNKISVCKYIANKNVYLFSVISYKRTMEGHENRAADKVNINKTSRFYCWMSRLLLEQVSNFVGQRTYIDYGKVTKMRVEFSDRGGLEIKQFRNYFEYLRNQSVTNSLYIGQYDLDWAVIDFKQMHSFANKDRAGLQLADTVASAFYCGLEQLSDAPPNPEYAKLLTSRMAIDDRRKIYGCGIKIMPRWIPDRLAGPAKNLVDHFIAR